MLAVLRNVIVSVHCKRSSARSNDQPILQSCLSSVSTHLIVWENFITINGNKIRYLESGTSDNVLILIHGLGASAERWNLVIPTFAKDYHVIVPDLIGFGYSDKPQVDYTPEFLSGFLGRFLGAMNINTCCIIGSSMGGQVAANFASSSPTFVRKLVLVSPSGIMKHSTPALNAYIMAALFPTHELARSAFEMMDASGSAVDERIVTGFVDRIKLPNAKRAFMSALLGLKNSKGLTNNLKNIKAPTLVLWGSNDPVIPVSYADTFVSSIGGCLFQLMDGCGHTPYVQCADIFSDTVLEFLTDTKA